MKAIEVRNIGKEYQLGRIGGGTLRHWLEDRIRKNSEYSSKKRFQALKDVSFDVNQGEVVGLIGRNGAGKSTMLKIISMITEPSTGEIILNGRVASLLEVGTGFHPELTGRENIFLNGSILGMTRKEIRERFDEIVDFAGVGEFIDTPVKRYSSGMYVRLAFAVAAHLESEILLVDEVLAVGDLEFQKKCLGKMDSISKSGRTVLFVSHNMGAISELCDRVIVFDKGDLIYDGEVTKGIDLYTRGNSGEVGEFTPKPNDDFWIQDLKLQSDEVGGTTFDIGDPLTLAIQTKAEHDLKDADVAVILLKGAQKVFFTIHSDQLEGAGISAGEHTFDLKLPPLSLTAGNYTLEVYLRRPSDGSHYDKVQGFDFLLEEYRSNTQHKGYAQKRGGITVFNGQWQQR